MKKIIPSMLAIASFSVCAFAQNPTAPASGSTNADNTARNARDQRPDPATADQQPNNPSDLKLLQSIRKAVIDDKPLSMNAKNCKIIVNGGAVVLRGPVESAEEKTRIAELAGNLAGKGKVTNELEIKAPAK